MPVKTALLSVSDKTGICELAKSLHDLGVKILSTGGTAKLIQDANIPVTYVSDVTGFPEIMGGRVKTLHPKIHGGILGKRDKHQKEADQHDIGWIDLVVVNLYPFAQTLKSGKPHDEIIENIDIGGPCMIRAAAKNHQDVGVIVDPSDYANLVTALKSDNNLDLDLRLKLAQKAFSHTAEYDKMISSYLSNEDNLDLGSHPKITDLRYGENPHQAASLYQDQNITQGSLLQAKQLQGKALSYNNYLDTDAALCALSEFNAPACIVVKHANPCGAALGDDINHAFRCAWAGDPKSAFGGIVALNRECSSEIASFLASVFVEVITAPSFDDKALEILSKKPNLRLLELKIDKSYGSDKQTKLIYGGVLQQDVDRAIISPKTCEIVTKIKPNEQMIRTLNFAYRVARYVKSNAIVIAKGVQTIGIGPGQVSRVDAVETAIKKAGEVCGDVHNLDGAVLASDAFFPFPDSIELIAQNTNIKAIIQPGGSIKDKEVIKACDDNNIAMVFTGKRVFRH
jgi:phosphoribosylaminoimidazolecarboxamide formyltransferase / IMP cyclohydrolase